MTHDEKIVEAVGCSIFHAKPRNRIWDALPTEFKNQYRKQARAAITAFQAEAWHDISTAPKDGAAIIGAFFAIRWADSHRKRDIVRCWWQPEFEAFISSCRQMTMAPGYAINGKTSELHSPVIEPITHWMPLPPEPRHDA